MNRKIDFRTLRKPVDYLVEEMIGMQFQINKQQELIEELCNDAINHGASISTEPFIPEYICMQHTYVEDKETGSRDSMYIYKEDDLEIAITKHPISVATGENLEENNTSWIVTSSIISPIVIKIENMLDAIHMMKILGSKRITIDNYITGKLCVK